MSILIAALPMYDWLENRAETDAEWAGMAQALRAAGIDAPLKLVRRNADLAAVPGGICDAEGRRIASDPASLPPNELDPGVLWRHPDLLLAQTCWGPMEAGLDVHVRVVGQPDYSAYKGGAGVFYSSAILMRKGDAPAVSAPANGRAIIPIAALRGKRFAYNEPASMSGFLALERDLEAKGEDLSLFSEHIETDSHRASALAVAERRADVCAVDCRTWTLIRRFEPHAACLRVVGWTAHRSGLPFITARAAPPERVALLQRALFRYDVWPKVTAHRPA